MPEADGGRGRDTVVVERSSSGRIVAAAAVVIAIVAVLHYVGLLPF